MPFSSSNLFGGLLSWSGWFGGGFPAFLNRIVELCIVAGACAVLFVAIRTVGWVIMNWM
jgi:hypothetical protein